MPSPRILFMDHTGSLGGAELFLLDVARHYRDTSTVALLEDGPLRRELEASAIPTRILPAPASVLQVQKHSHWWQMLSAIPEIVRLTVRVASLARTHDLIYANSQKALVVGTLAGVLARRPVVWHLHDMLTADHFSTATRTLAIFLANHFVDRVIVNSDATRTAFVDSGGDESKTGIVYNGFNVDHFPMRPTRSPMLANELGLQPGTPLVGVFSRLAPWKGQDVLVRALTDLPSVHAVFVGDALFRGDASYADKLRNLATTLEVAGRVHFLGFRQDIPQLMSSVDLALHTSTAPEPFGRVIVESQLTGTPVVATAAGGALEIVQDGDNGVLVAPGDPDALAQAVRRLLSSPKTAAALAERARIDAATRFALPTTISALVRELSHVIA